MEAGEQDVERIERLDAEETLVRFVESPWSDPRVVAQRSDPAEDLGGPSDRGRRHLGRLATRKVVVLPQLMRTIGGTSLRSAGVTVGDLEGGAAS